MQKLVFALGRPLQIEESLNCEFKEIKNQNPIQAIGKTVDEYVVAFLNETAGSIYWGIRDDRTVVGVELNAKMRDELKQVVGQKIAAIAPPVSPDRYEIPFHQVIRAEEEGSVAVANTFVVEVCVRSTGNGLYLTGGGEAYRKTLGGIKKLTGAELLTALLVQLQEKVKTSAAFHGKKHMDLSWMPSVANRAAVVQPLLAGARCLWVDDNPGNNLYERTALASFGISVDPALSTEEALYMADRIGYDLILSDMKRGANPSAGSELLEQLRVRQPATPIVFYVGHVNRRPPPAGAFAITDRPDQLLHYIFDVLERRIPERAEQHGF